MVIISMKSQCMTNEVHCLVIQPVFADQKKKERKEKRKQNELQEQGIKYATRSYLVSKHPDHMFLTEKLTNEHETAKLNTGIPC